MKSSISDNGIYPNLCKKAFEDDEIFNVFRKSKEYCNILEHVNHSQGVEYYKIIKKQYPDLLNNIVIYKTNDDIGSPNKYNIGDIINISPTTMRYIKVTGELHNYFGDLSGKDIVEIGCGYGGQAKIILNTFDVNSYTIIDLPEVIQLIEKYLKSFNLPHDKIKYKTIDNLESKNYDLFISNYAFTECNKETQSKYYDLVLKNSKSGYITANFINDVFGLDYYNKNELLELLPNPKLVDENPKTHVNNIIIIWGEGEN